MQELVHAEDHALHDEAAGPPPRDGAIGPRPTHGTPPRSARCVAGPLVSGRLGNRRATGQGGPCIGLLDRSMSLTFNVKNLN